jgi:peroxiredoxin
MRCELAPEFRGAQIWQMRAPLRAVVLTIFLLLGSQPSVHAGQLARIDEPAKPDFSLRDLDGKSVALEAFRGRTVVVHFFATWCEPCREELPALGRFLDRSAYSANNASVLAISVAEPDQRLQRFFEQMPVNFPVLLDPDRNVTKSWKISALPTTYILDADMKPVLMVEGEFAWDTIDPDQIGGSLFGGKFNATEVPSDRAATLKPGGK